MTWHFKDGDWNEYEDRDCVCGHLEHGDGDCPEQVRMGGVLHSCGCDDYVPSRFDSTTQGKSGR